MPFLSNKDAINIAEVQKAISTSDLSGGGLLSAEDAVKFLQKLQERSQFLGMLSFEEMTRMSKRIDSFTISSRQLRKKEEGLDPGNRGGITTSRKTLTLVKTMLPIEISDDTFEQNIEKEGFEEKVMGDFAKATANDLADLAVNGDVDSVSNFLNINDGYIKLAKANGNVYNTGGSTVDADNWHGLLNALPEQYNLQDDGWRIFVSRVEELRMRKTLSTRATSLGDAYLDQNKRVRYLGVLVEPIQTWPIGIQMLSHTDNLAYGIGFAIKIERDKDIFKGMRQYAITSEVDFEFRDDDATVVGYNTGS